jgi:hypothetical protein
VFAEPVRLVLTPVTSSMTRGAALSVRGYPMQGEKLGDDIEQNSAVVADIVHRRREGGGAVTVLVVRVAGAAP